MNKTQVLQNLAIASSVQNKTLMELIVPYFHKVRNREVPLPEVRAMMCIQDFYHYFVIVLPFQYDGQNIHLEFSSTYKLKDDIHNIVESSESRYDVVSSIDAWNLVDMISTEFSEHPHTNLYFINEMAKHFMDIKTDPFSMYTRKLYDDIKTGVFTEEDLFSTELLISSAYDSLRNLCEHVVLRSRSYVENDTVVCTVTLNRG